MPIIGMRKDFEMSQARLDELLDASQSEPVKCWPGRRPIFKDPQESANNVWTKLGKELGFKPSTVRPNGKGERFFSAVAI